MSDARDRLIDALEFRTRDSSDFSGRAAALGSITCSSDLLLVTLASVRVSGATHRRGRKAVLKDILIRSNNRRDNQRRESVTVTFFVAPAIEKKNI